MNDLRYPIGKFSYDGSPSEDQRRTFCDQIAEAPAKLQRGGEGTFRTATRHSLSS